ncbi:ATP-binding cassette domain-containing protein [Agrilactobacillus yilanensis]|uniref:ATP-binding cassette domain-containing protein n=1 Tax=Agrilactobacillus yilanensis TaxID=2485997 RepID=A0ABW4JAI0_9LACO|nr:ABC transporter ATP-binding protein [Agrilactobacillus yilanensis]
MNMLELKGVTKAFGAKSVLKDLNLIVPQGSIFGFVGENGAGKTTTMKLILGLDKPDTGTIFVKGQQVNFGQTATNQVIGYLPDVPEFYDYMTATEYLQLCGEITKIAKQERAEKIETMLQLVGLPNNKHRIKGFSRGMRQRLGIAQALLNDPELLICDEPTSALDPEGRHDFLQLLTRLRGKITILFSTHILSDVQTVCDEIGILHHGQLQVTDTLTNLKKTYLKPQIALTFQDIAQAKAGQQLIINELALIGEVQENKLLVSYGSDYKTASQKILSLLLTHDLVPLAFNQVEPTLEQIFLQVMQS